MKTIGYIILTLSITIFFTHLLEILLLLTIPQEDKTDPVDLTGKAKRKADEKLIGTTGITATALRPSGYLQINGERYAARTEGDFVDAGVPITIIDARGSDLIVKTG
jgi:membrane-bound serine protease (ClpP class)